MSKIKTVKEWLEPICQKCGSKNRVQELNRIISEQPLEVETEHFCKECMDEDWEDLDDDFIENPVLEPSKLNAGITKIIIGNKEDDFFNSLGGNLIEVDFSKNKI